MSKIIITMLSIVIIGFIVMLPLSYEYMNEQTIECKVEDKWIKRSSNNADLYLVNCGETIYKVSDLLFKGKFNSSDIYGKLKIGEEYKLRISGYRMPLISEYQNINEIVD